MKKVLALVLSADIAGYDKLVQSIKETWGKWTENFKVLYYYGYRDNFLKPPLGEVLQVDENLICGCDENLNNINYKTLLTYKYIYQKCIVEKAYEFDYIFRCCCGSYVVQDELLKFVENKPLNNFYCGVIGDPNSKRPFASGSGYFLSRDLVKLVSENFDKILRIDGLPGDQDDVAMGAFMYSIGVRAVNANRVDDSDAIIKNAYHYHFRHNEKYMRNIHNKLIKDLR